MEETTNTIVSNDVVSVENPQKLGGKSGKNRKTRLQGWCKC